MAGRTNNTSLGGNSRTVALEHPQAGMAETVRLGAGQTLDLSKIAGDNITLLKLDGRLIVLFPDKAHIIVEGFYLPGGDPARDISVNLDGATTLNAANFVTLFPISSDEQILTAAGVSLPPPAAQVVGSGSGTTGTSFESLAAGPRTLLLDNVEFADADASAAARPAGAQASQQAVATTATTASPAASPALQAGPVAADDVVNVVESGFSPGNSPFPGTSTIAGNLVANDTVSGTVSIVAAGTAGQGTAAGVGAAVAGLYGSVTINSDGSFTYTLNNEAGSTQALQQGQQASDLFTYVVTDSTGQTSTATLRVLVTGTNDLPVLDIDGGAAGTGYQGLTAGEAARSSATVEAAQGVSIARAGAVLVTDPDNDTYSQLKVTVGAVAGGEAGQLVRGTETGPELTFTAGPGGFSAADIQGVLEGIRYVNTERTFALDITDRQIAVLLTDIHGGQTTVTATVPVIADVRDTTGLNAFTGTRFDDRIEGMGGADTIRAGDGNDTVIYRAGDGTDAVLDGGAGTDRLVVLGTAADNVIKVSFDNTVLTRLSSEGDEAANTQNLTAFESVTLDGDSGTDMLSYAGSLAPVAVDLAAGTASGFTSIASIENVTGGFGNDTLRGSDAANLLIGGDDNDILDGRGGDNTLTGGAGDDTIVAGDGLNVIDAGSGDNSITVGSGNNMIVAADGDNSVLAGSGDNTVTVGAGSNDITTGAGDDTILAGDGDNLVQAGDGINNVTAGDGANDITTGTGDDSITAGDGDNTIRAGSGMNTVAAGDGTNDILTGADDDTIVVGAGDNTVQAGDGDNTVLAGDGDNAVTVGTGSNDITTGAGSDTILAGDGDNIIQAGDGTNSVTAGHGANDITAGAGDDTIATGDGDNTIRSGEGTNNVLTGAGNDDITLEGTVDQVNSGAGDDTIKVIGTGRAEIRAGDGEDNILAGIGNDIIFGGDGADYITTGLGADRIAYENLTAGMTDTVADFTSGTDSFQFLATEIGNDLAVGGAGSGILDSSRFIAGTDFTDADQRFLFNTTEKTLYFDADGAGAADSMIALAHLETGTVAAADIKIV